MDIRKLQRAIVDGLEDVKAQDILVFNTEHLSALFERVIVASGTSNRQTKALAASVRDAVRGRGMEVLRTEGEDNGEWIIVDCGAAVVHVMQPAIREYYHLEEIWGEKAIHLKSAGAKTSTRLVKASEDGFAAAPAKTKAAEKKTASKKVVAAGVKTASKSGGKTFATKTSAKTPAARKSTPRVSPATKTPVRKAPSSQAPAGRTSAGKTPAGKTPTRKTPMRSTAGKPAGKTLARKPR